MSSKRKLFVSVLLITICFSARTVISSSSLEHINNKTSSVIPQVSKTKTPDQEFFERVREVSGVVQPLACTPISVYEGLSGEVRYRVVRGGILTTVMRRRAGLVGEFVKDANAAAGINGTFFGASHCLVGPAWSPQSSLCLQSPFVTTKGKEIGRPLVVWNDDSIAFVPYLPEQLGLTQKSFWDGTSFTNGFVAGEWLVHEGKAMERPAEIPVPLYGQNGHRPRSFFGITPDGVPFIAATVDKVTVANAAKVAQAYGAWEAVLLDSGYSTSLIYQDQEIVTGDHPPKKPRLVPHVILVNQPSLEQIIATTGSVSMTMGLCLVRTPVGESGCASPNSILAEYSQPNPFESSFPEWSHPGPFWLGQYTL